MAAINRERFVQLATCTIEPRKTHNFLYNIIHATNRFSWNGPEPVIPGPLDIPAAEAMFDKAKVYLMANGHFNGKGFRPWEVDEQIYNSLDRSKAWWGFEFETGYVSQEARAEVLGNVWDRWDNVAFDAEGEGTYYTEITFSPQTRDEYTNGTSQAQAFMQYLSDNPQLTNHTNASSVGTHINISHPDITSSNAHNVEAMLNNTLHLLPESGARKRLFGREYLYGGFFQRSGPRSANVAGSITPIWLEGKVFRTTYDADQFADYLKVCEALTVCIEAALEMKNADPALRIDSLGVNNLEEVVNGIAPLFVTHSWFEGDGEDYYVNGNKCSDGVDHDWYDDDDLRDEF